MGNKGLYRKRDDFTCLDKVTPVNQSEILELIPPDTLRKPDLTDEFDFQQIEFKKGHIILTQYLQIHRYFTKKTHQAKNHDKYRSVRRAALKERDHEGYKFFVLKQLAYESDSYDQVVSDLVLGLNGFTLEQYERDTQHYRMNRLTLTQIQSCTAETLKQLKPSNHTEWNNGISLTQLQEMVKWRQGRKLEVQVMSLEQADMVIDLQMQKARLVDTFQQKFGRELEEME